MSHPRSLSLSLAGSVTMVLQVTGQLLTFGAHALFARVAGASEYGIFSIAMALGTILLIAGRGGQDMVVLRGVASLEVEKKWGEIRARWRASNWIVVLISTALVVVAMALSDALDAVPASVMGWPLTLSLLCIPVLSLSSLRYSALLALRRPYAAQVSESMVRPALLFIAATVAFAMTAPLSALQMLALSLFAAIAGLVTGEVFCRRSFGGTTGNEATTGPSPSLLMPGLWMLVGVGAYQAIMQVDLLALGYISGEETAGTYAAASKVSVVAQYGLLALQTLATPAIAAAYAAGRKGQLQTMLKQTARLATAFAAVAALVAWVLADQILSIFGPQFVAGADVLRVLVLAHLVNAATGVTGGLLMMTGSHRAAGVITTSCLLLQLVLLAWLVPRWGALGAALSTTLSTSAAHMAMALWAWRRLRVRTWLTF